MDILGWVTPPIRHEAFDDEQETVYGKCNLCGKERYLQRKYWYYDIPCKCHRHQHSEFRDLCAECAKKDWEPRCTEITLPVEVCHLVSHLSKLSKEGRLLELPCKVGDIVYFRLYSKCKCISSNHTPDNLACESCRKYNEHSGIPFVCDGDKIVHPIEVESLEWLLNKLPSLGKTWFLTEEEAKKGWSK